MTTSNPGGAFAALPDPGGAQTIDELIEQLKALKIWAGEPSYEVITERINARWAQAGRPQAELARRGTVVDCFKPGRRRLNIDLVVAVVQALHPETGYMTQWQQVLRALLGETRAAAQVRAQERLPGDPAHFTGRAVELDKLARARAGERSGKAAIAVIEGMPGIGKTQLAIHAGHLLEAAGHFERVLFVQLRGFHPDPAQPPADPAAVLDSFLRLLGVAGQKIPHDLPARGALFRRLLAQSPALLVLDDAADEDQVRPLLPDSPGSLTLITSRRSLTGLEVDLRLAVEVFSADEAAEFLKRTVPEVPVGRDPRALDRIAQRCGHLPLALNLVAARMSATTGWTLTDHADRLDERHHNHRLDSGVELALGLSYDHLEPERRMFLRLLALHPGPDFDRYAAAALAGTGPQRTAEDLRLLRREHLLEEGSPGRIAVHDLVRAHAVQRARDEDKPSDRRAALTRLFDSYLSTAAAAMDLLYPADRDRRPRVPKAPTAIPAFADVEAARAWLDSERANLVATTICATANDCHGHAIDLAATLFRYLISGYFTDAITIFDQARAAARHSGDTLAEAEALFGLGTVHARLGRHAMATDYLQRALDRFREAGSRGGQARALGNLGAVAQRRADYPRASDYHRQAVTLFEQVGDLLGAGRALNNLGELESRLGHYDLAAEYLWQVMRLHGEEGDPTGRASTLTNLGTVEMMRGRHAEAVELQMKALELFTLSGHQSGQAWSLDGVALAYAGLGRFDEAVAYHQKALDLFQQIGERDGEAWALNGLAEVAHRCGRHDRAIAQHTAALAVATEVEVVDQQARAHHGMARVHLSNGKPEQARRHWQEALTRYTDLGVPEAETVRAELAALEAGTAAG